MYHHCRKRRYDQINSHSPLIILRCRKHKQPKNAHTQMHHNAEKKRLCNDWIILDQSINLYNSFGFFATKDGILPRSLGRRPVEYGQHSTVVLLPGWKKWHGRNNDIILNMTNSPWHPHSSLQYAAGHQAKCLKCSSSFGEFVWLQAFHVILCDGPPKYPAKTICKRTWG